VAVVDEKKVVREWLIVPGTTLYQLCGTRVFFPRLPENVPGQASIFDGTLPGIAFDSVPGGTAPIQGLMRSVSIELHCFGGGTEAKKGEGACYDVYRKLVDRFTNGSDQYIEMQSTDSGVIMSCEELSVGVLDETQVTRESVWPHVETVWSFEIRASS